MRMPGGAGTRLERDACATNISGLTRDRPITRRFPSGFTVYPSVSRHDVFPRLEQRVNANPAGEIFGWSFCWTFANQIFLSPSSERRSFELALNSRLSTLNSL
jgi:hypothetical protein